ncbi:NAD(P)-binding domain-containing protein [Phytoactinopolyspora halotolerans]|uniref:NAD(P)-binding domain-containing protein n=1 Tax=Phytoactinopolyspora halotolerans TaxID=1981512 RepID=A0A6L9S7T6_9ACTN|nr:NAD(P)-binding domain-containing protein [Phytoactinopolyspora halotolerans]NEE00588.1 NAD(P)-binding domain-containing protein [Phytoactinopolyspora halotolerans]
MRTIETVVIGAGQAGLATSRYLTGAGRDHVVLERGRVAESWLSARWDSLRLLTPNWMTRLPAWSYAGDEPDGFMTAAGLAGYLSRYADSFGAPVLENTPVTDVSAMAHGFRVTTWRGSWFTRNVVLASGPSRVVPELARRLQPEMHQLHTSGYRRPGRLPSGGVLVVGASASGAQIAAELCRSGRTVVLSVGSHTRLPRRYRGMDIMWWLEQSGLLSRTIDEMPDARAARAQPSLQLRGGAPAVDLDLATLHELGVRTAGRLVGVDGDRVHFADDLASTVSAAESRLRRTLDTIDRFAESTGLDAELLPAEPVRAVDVAAGPSELDLRAAGISTVVWATGFRHRYPWLRVPVFDRDGQVVHRRGITAVPGLYVIGERFLHRRDSSFIDGVRHDARTISEHLGSSSQAGRRGPRRRVDIDIPEGARA